MVVAETFGFRFEADLFTSVQMILGCGVHGHHRDAPPSKTVAADIVGFKLEADLFKVVEDNTETFS